MSIADRWEELNKDTHIRAQAERIMPALTLVQGTKNCPTLEDVIRDIATAIVALEESPEIQQTANVGGILVARGPNDGYGVYVWVTDIYHLRMDDAFTKPSKP